MHQLPRFHPILRQYHFADNYAVVILALDLSPFRVAAAVITVSVQFVRSQPAQSVCRKEKQRFRKRLNYRKTQPLTITVALVPATVQLNNAITVHIAVDSSAIAILKFQTAAPNPMPLHNSPFSLLPN